MNIIDKFLMKRVEKLLGSPETPIITAVNGLSNNRNTYSTDSEILEALDTSPIFAACTYKIAEAMAAVNWRLYVNRNSNGKAVGRKAYDIDTMTEVPEYHPFYDLLEGLNPDMPGLTGFILTYSWWVTVGRCYWVVIRDDTKGMPQGFYPVPTSSVVTRDGSGYQFRFGNDVKFIPKENVVLWNNPSPADPYRKSRGVGKTLGDELYVSEMAAKLQGTYFKENGMPPAIISPETGVIMDKDALVRFEERFLGKMRGLGKQYVPYFTNAPINVQQLSNTFRDMQLTEMQKDHRDFIIASFGMSKEMLGIIDNSNRATVDAASYMFLKFVIEPKIKQIQSFLQYKILPLYDENLVLQYDDFIPEDKEYKAKIVGSHEWAFTRDEIRAMAGLGEGDGEDYSMAPFNLLPDKSVKPMFTKSRKILNPENIDLILEEIGEAELLSAVGGSYKALLIDVMKDAYGEIGYTGREDTLARGVSDYLDNYVGEKIRGINNTTKDKIRKIVRDGMDEYLPVEQIAEKIGGVFDSSIGRLNTIARTETHSAQSFGVTRAYRDSGLVKYKRWIHNPELSEEPRDDHAALDGLVAGLNEPFTYMGMEADYPGGFGIAEQDINCHCTEAAVITDEDLEEYEARDYMPLWTKRRNQALRYEPVMKKAYAKGFEEQKDKVLQAIRRLT
jgi:HK97 family phage portal protein